MQLYSEKAIWATESSSLLSAGIQVEKMAVRLYLNPCSQEEPPSPNFLIIASTVKLLLVFWCLF